MRDRAAAALALIGRHFPFESGPAAPEAVSAAVSGQVTVRCRCCGGRNVIGRGKIPDSRNFAGRLLPAPLAGGSLFRCASCAFVFRFPIYTQSEYDALYREGSSSTWDDTDRIDHELVRDAVRRHSRAGSVLDVGCGGGRLLMPLAGQYSTFGVEINAQAARKAEDRGVRIVASDVREMQSLGRQFDAVVCCDVIEHLPEPLEFVRTLLSVTAPGGLLAISTANANAWSWRLAGSRFWYCYLPEHISFVSPEWFGHHEPALGAGILEVRKFTYTPRFSLTGTALRLALMTLFGLSPSLYYKLLPQSKQRNIPVGRGITPDHFLIALRKG
jgi:SAM-dependent methyltransferase